MERVAWDMAAYLQRVRRACYVCELLRGNPEYAHHVAYRDDTAVVYLNKYPSVWGHTLVAPVAHREHVVGDLSEDEYVAFQRVVHRAGRALTRVVPTERLYTLSLGSRQGNTHVHLHLVPCPPGTPYERQQLALLAESDGWLDAPEDDLAALAAAIGDAMGEPGRP